MNFCSRMRSQVFVIHCPACFASSNKTNRPRPPWAATTSSTAPSLEGVVRLGDSLLPSAWPTDHDRFGGTIFHAFCERSFYPHLGPKTIDTSSTFKTRIKWANLPCTEGTSPSWARDQKDPNMNLRTRVQASVDMAAGNHSV